MDINKGFHTLITREVHFNPIFTNQHSPISRMQNGTQILSRPTVAHAPDRDLWLIFSPAAKHGEQRTESSTTFRCCPTPSFQSQPGVTPKFNHFLLQKKKHKSTRNAFYLVHTLSLTPDEFFFLSSSDIFSQITKEVLQTCNEQKIPYTSPSHLASWSFSLQLLQLVISLSWTTS